jgi:hypothetical protein
MEDPFADYRMDTLILLVGENPLPNYVAARLLATPKSRLLLVHSSGTRTQRDNLKKVLELEDKGYTIGPNDTVEVEESNPANISKKLTSSLAKCNGTVGLNYTGGTKTMAVHAYRVLEQVNGTIAEKQYSYLDARSLSMVFSHRSTPVPINHHEQANISLEELLQLHGLEKTRQKMKGQESLFWKHTTQALAHIHAKEDLQKAWREWCNDTLRNNKGDNIEKIADLKTRTTEHIPHTEVIQALESDTGLVFPQPLSDLIPQTNREAKKLTNWLGGTWLEEYVFRQIEPLCDDTALGITDLKMTINPEIGSNDFEFDVGFMRGHQFFGLSCTTEDGASGFSLLKSKLFEVAIRAEQLGGGEAQFAVVCCANPDKVQKLQTQLSGLPGAKRLQVFGRNDLLSLQDCLRKWITEASKGR